MVRGIKYFAVAAVLAFGLNVCVQSSDAAPKTEKAVKKPAERLSAGLPKKPVEVKKPDLVISKIVVEKETITAGERDTNVVFFVKNIGQAPVEGEIVCAITGKTGYMTVPGGLAEGEEKEYSFLVGHAEVWPAGRYRIKVKADSANAIGESNENNNESNEISFEVVAPVITGNLQVVTRYTDSQMDFSGGEITVTDKATGETVGTGTTPCDFELPVKMYRVSCTIPDLEALDLEYQIATQSRDTYLEEVGVTEPFFFGQKRE
ncbi:MAG: hypothetical protein HQL30_10145 [Candidatus Omnitrophica bacterium]|nr:hypothetical protein [Candidatus Omnitrophota bacterium]